MTIYWVSNICISFSISTYMTSQIVQTGQFADWAGYFMTSCFLCLIFCGIFSIIYAYLKLSKPGISGTARSLVLKRHAAGIILYVLCNLYVALISIYNSLQLTPPNPAPSAATWWLITLKLLFFSEGLLSPLVRLTEDAFIIGISSTFKSDIQMILCCFKQKRDREDAFKELFDD